MQKKEQLEEIKYYNSLIVQYRTGVALYQRLDDIKSLVFVNTMKYHLSYFTLYQLPHKNTISVFRGANQPESAKPFTTRNVHVAVIPGRMASIWAETQLAVVSVPVVRHANGRFKVLL